MIRGCRVTLTGSSLIVAALVMWWWVRSFDVSGAAVNAVFRHLSWWPVLPLFALVAGHVALSSWRWSLIEAALAGTRPRFGPAFATGAFAQGLGTFLPSPLVHVACRGLANRMNGASGMRGAVSGGIDQIADFAIILLMAVPAAFAFARRDAESYYLGAALMLPVGLFFTLFLPLIVRSIWLPGFLRRKGEALLRLDRPILLKIYGISLIRLFSLTLMNILIHAAIGVGTISAIVVSVPLVALTTSVAMLPGAIGVSEWSFSAVFAGFSIAPSAIVLFVLANRILLTGVSLAIALIILLAKMPAWLGRAPQRRG